MMAAAFQLFPYSLFRPAVKAAKDWIQDDNYKHYLGIRPEKFIHFARHPGEGVTINLPDKAQGGVTFITGFWDGNNRMKLIEPDGASVHEWRASFQEIWPDSEKPHSRIRDWDSEIHGAELYPNGDVVFNFEYEGLAKIDRCSNVIWKVPSTHHSVFRDAEGNLWVPGREQHFTYLERFPLLLPNIFEEFIIKISPAGEILRKISLLGIFYKSGQEAILFANGDFGTERLAGDIIHLNDIEILEKSMADRFPLFEAGDIMVSSRHLNWIAVIDSVTEKIKWHQTGPFIRQHDPDFLPNGRIMVFDNRADTISNSRLGGSRILSLDPVTRKVETLYEGDAKREFYTRGQGKGQPLANGNILLTEAASGRAFEVTPEKEVVWEFINRYDEDEILVITQATRYDNHYMEFAKGEEKCP